MLRKAEITAPGGSSLLKGEQLERTRVLEENEKLEADGKKPAEWVAYFTRYYEGITFNRILYLCCVISGNNKSSY